MQRPRGLFEDRLCSLSIFEKEVAGSGKAAELRRREEVNRRVGRVYLIEMRFGSCQCLFTRALLPEHGVRFGSVQHRQAGQYVADARRRLRRLRSQVESCPRIVLAIERYEALT